VPASDGWAVVSGEGGHSTLPATTEEEQRVIELVRKQEGHCSAESFLSGPGLVRLYVTLAELAGRGRPTVTPQDVTSLAKGSEPLARRRRRCSSRCSARWRARGDDGRGPRRGVHRGGIVPQLLDALAKSEFRERFEARAAIAPTCRRSPRT